jgi:uncharacterized phage protein gp47/JayE
MSIPINKTLEDVRRDLYDRIAEVRRDGFLPAELNLNRGPFRGLIELWAWGLYQLYRLLVVVLSQVFPQTSTGSWLDMHAAQVGVTRLAATKAAGVVYFVRSDTAGNVKIPAGRIVKTRPDGLGNVYRFVTTSAVVLADGETEVAAPVTAEEYGRDSNVAAGMIALLSTAVPGVSTVENRSDWLASEGADEETDEQLLERYTLAWMDANGATTYAYQAWARSVPGVVDVKILDQHPRGQGTVDVIVRGAAGVPTASLLTAVEEVVEEKRPINDDVRVAGPTAVSVAIEGELVLRSGTPGVITAEAQSRLSAMFQDPPSVAGIRPIGIGEDLTLDRLTGLVMAVTGVHRVDWSLPSADVIIPGDGLAVLSGMTLTWSWSEDA